MGIAGEVGGQGDHPYGEAEVCIRVDERHNMETRPCTAEHQAKSTAAASS